MTTATGASSAFSHRSAEPIDVRLMNVAALVLGVAACVFSLGLFLKWALALPVFAISKIVVEGDTTHHNAITLKANVGGRIRGNFFTVDLMAAKQVFETVPWVRKARVRREFPNRLRVVLQEHQSAAFWGANSELRMVNSLGEIFEANVGDAENDELPRFIAADGQSTQMLEMYLQLSGVFKPIDVFVEQLELSGRGAWRIVLDGGAHIELGHGSIDEVKTRLQKFVSTHQQVLNAYQRSDLNRVESVDLRHVGGYAIRMSGVSTLATTDKK